MTGMFAEQFQSLKVLGPQINGLRESYNGHRDSTMATISPNGHFTITGRKGILTATYLAQKGELGETGFPPIRVRKLEL